MLITYIVPLFITAFLAFLMIWFLKFRGKPAGGNVEIIISGDEEAENLEHAVQTAKRLSCECFKTARVFIRGSDSTYVNALCKRYDVQRKE